MHERQTICLKVVPADALRKAISAPPVLEASSHTVDYVCGHCRTILMHAEQGQVHNLLIQCTAWLLHSTEAEPPQQFAKKTCVPSGQRLKHLKTSASC